MSENQNISMKIGLDTSQFNNSVKGMALELKALQKIDLTLIKPEDAKAVIARMGDLKDSIKDVKKEIDNADPGQFFQSFSTLAGPAVAAISGIATGMEIFGAKTEEVEKVQRKMMGLISIISTLQTIADANKLKGLLKQIPLQAAELKNRIVNTLLIKQETVATEAQIVATGVQSVATKSLTKAQLMWNAALLANPVGLIIAGIAALTAGVYLLVKAFKKQDDQVKDNQKTTDGLIMKNKELRDSYDDTLKAIQNMRLEFDRDAGIITLFQFEKKKIKQDLDDTVRTIEKERDDKLAEMKAKSKDRDKVVQLIKWGTEVPQAELDKAVEELSKNQKKIYDIISTTNGKILNENNRYNEQESIMKGLQRDKLNIEIDAQNNDRTRNTIDALKNELAQKEFEFGRIYGAETRFQELITALRTKYALKIKEEETKQALERKKLVDDNYNKLLEATVNAETKLAELKGVDTKQSQLDAQYQKELEAQKALYDKKTLNDEEYEKAKLEIQKKYAIESQILALTAEQEKAKKVADFNKEYLVQSMNQQMNAEIAELYKRGKEIGKKEEDLVKEVQNIKDKYKEEEANSDVQRTDETIEKKRQLELDGLDKNVLSVEQYRAKEQEINARYDKLEEEALKAKEEKKMMSLDLIQQASLAALQIIADQQQANNDAEMNRIQTEFDTKKTKLDEQLSYGLISQSEYDAEMARMEKKRAEEERQLRIKQAKSEKLLGLFQIAINTAMAVMKAFATLGPAGGAIAAPFIIGAGAAEAAIVAAKPIPQFAAGGKMKKTGPAIVGEKGIEIVELPAGSNVIPNNEVNNYLNTNRTSQSSSGGRTNSSEYNRLSEYLIQGNNINRYTTNAPMLNNSSLTFSQMKDFVGMSFERYSQIPVVVSEYEITDKQTKVKQAKVNSEVM